MKRNGGAQMHWRATRCVSLLFFLVLSRVAAQTGVEKKPSNDTTAKPTNETISKPKATAKTAAPSTPKKEPAKKKSPPKEKVEPMASTKGCGPGCEVCHDDHCFSCLEDFQRINYACEKKGCSDAKCMDCSADVCYKCVAGYAPDIDGFCTWIGPDGCDEKNCKLCESTRIGCTECMHGFQLRSNQCFKNACLDENCLRCSTNGKECELCKEGFQSRLGKCLKVGCLDDRCRQCSPSGGSCYRCEDGYYSNQYEGPCKACPDDNCLNCNGSQNSCIRCVEGFYVGRISGKVGCLECGKAVDYCQTCSRNGDDCYSCKPGYYLEHGHCIGCPEDCASCKSPWFCDTCREGYDLLGSGMSGKNATLNGNSAERRFPMSLLYLAGLFHLILAVVIL